MNTRSMLVLFLGLFSGIAIVATALSITGCGSGCSYVEERFTKISNTLSAPVTVSFRHHPFSLNDHTNEKTETFAVGESREIFLYNYKNPNYAKAGVIKALCDLKDIRKTDNVMFSIATLKQYTVCSLTLSNPDDRISPDISYAIRASTDTCNADERLETSGY